MAKGLCENALHDANQVRPRCLVRVALINSERLGHSPSIFSMEPRERVGGMGKGKFDGWFVEGRFDCHS